MATGTLIREHEEREYLRREFNYAVRNGRGKRDWSKMAVVEYMDLEKARQELGRMTRARKALEKQLQLPVASVDDRKALVRDCVAAGMSQGDIARAMRVSRQRVHQLVGVAQECPF